ncbi:MAG: response regulator [Planctomycetota bacterium]
MRKVLIVDDSATMRKILMRSLRQAEIKLEEILEASNGIEALAQIASNPEIELILSDINMPEMGGIDLVKNVRATKTADELPILMVTTEGGSGMVASAMESGANGYVTKPFTPEVLKDAIQRINS